MAASQFHAVELLSAKYAVFITAEKRPKYREDRHHEAFLAPLSKHAECRTSFLNAIIERLSDFFQVTEENLESIQEVSATFFRIATREEKPSLGV